MNIKFPVEYRPVQGAFHDVNNQMFALVDYARTMDKTKRDELGEFIAAAMNEKHEREKEQA